MTAARVISGNRSLAARSWLERMTGIEPALSAWESVQFRLSGRPTCDCTGPRVTVTDRESLALMAR